MDTSSATDQPTLGPIDPNWTISELVEWLSDDVCQHDPALQHPLSRIETAVTGGRWAGTPSTIALIRSLVEAVRDAPGLRSLRIRDLVRPEPQELPTLRDRTPQLV